MQLLRRVKRKWNVFTFTVKSLSYNSSRSPNHYVDAAFEPLFWFVDNFTTYLGLIFVVFVAIGISTVVIIWYKFLFPVIQTYSTAQYLFHLFYAHYLLINIVFHYFKAVTTSGGMPPEDSKIGEIQRAVVCKKCVRTKPPRTHHCSICGECRLKMDHHCPWMNNCIGFYNHRYFISFCIFMWLGTVYVCLTTYQLFAYHTLHPDMLLSNPLSLSFSVGMKPLFEHLDSANRTGNYFKKQMEKLAENYDPHPGGFEDVHEYENVACIFVFILCGAVTIALTFLNVWNIIMATRGETSIEVHVNRSQAKEAASKGMGYSNPYDYGALENWKVLLGISSTRSILYILFPSTHLPEGDGMHWRSNGKPVHYYDPTAYKRFEKQQNKRCCGLW